MIDIHDDDRVPLIRSCHSDNGSRREEKRETPSLPFTRGLIATDIPPCPKCGGRMWDNRIGKRNPRAPDFKCRDRSCDGVVWPSRPAAGETTAETTPGAATGTTDQVPF